MANSTDRIVLITRDQYDKIRDMLLDSSPALLPTTRFPMKPLSYNPVTKEVKRIPGEGDIEDFLKQYNARLGKEIKKYNPYVWRREIIFETEQDATMFVLKEL